MAPVAQQNAAAAAAVVAQRPPPPKPITLKCDQVELRGDPAYLCVSKPSAFEPYLVGLPAVAVAILGFIVVHALSVRRQRRDEQFKMVQSTRELIAAVAKDAEEAWLDRKGRAIKAQRLIQQIGRVGRAIQQLRVRHRRLDDGGLVTQFRQAITLDFEEGAVSAERSAEIAIAAAELDERIIRQFLEKYG